MLPVDIPDHLPNPERYLTGQTAKEIVDQEEWQYEFIDEVIETDRAEQAASEAQPQPEPVKPQPSRKAKTTTPRTTKAEKELRTKFEPLPELKKEPPKEVDGVEIL